MTAGYPNIVTNPVSVWAWALCVFISPLLAAASGIDDKSIPEPATYRMDNYIAPTPDTLQGATVVNAEELHQLIQRHPDTALIDVLPAMRKPPDFPANRLWRPPTRYNIPGSTWLPNVGYGGIAPNFQEYLIRNMNELKQDNPERKLVFYCLENCWMSWNAAKKALELGYSNVYWFPGGTDEWEFMDYELKNSKPESMPDFVEKKQ